MGIEFVVYNQASGKTFICESVKWLRDDAPHELFYGNINAMKEMMTTEDIRHYMEDIKRYLDALMFKEADLSDEDDYDKWISSNDKEWIEDWMYGKLTNFVNILQQACELGLVARWSY